MEDSDFVLEEDCDNRYSKVKNKLKYFFNYVSFFNFSLFKNH